MHSRHRPSSARGPHHVSPYWQRFGFSRDADLERFLSVVHAQQEPAEPPMLATVARGALLFLGLYLLWYGTSALIIAWK